MILHHYTSTIHLPFILRDGHLRTTESNVGSPWESWPPYGEHVGPDVVWLLDTPEPGATSHGLSGGRSDKTAVRLTVDTDSAVPWEKWRPRREMHPSWREAFVAAGGGTDASAHWWVSEAAIFSNDWVDISIHGVKQDLSSWRAARPFMQSAPLNPITTVA